jgi:hypothetical protein
MVDESGPNFQKPTTFLQTLVKCSDSEKRGNHLVRLDVLENEQCNFYDPNSGKYTGPCPKIISIYQKAVAFYKPKKVDVISISSQVNPEPKKVLSREEENEEWAKIMKQMR